MIELKALIITQTGHEGGRHAIELPDGRLIVAGAAGLRTFSSRAVMERLHPGIVFREAPERAQQVINAVHQPEDFEPEGALD